MEGKGANGEWGGICQKDFDINEANIIANSIETNDEKLNSKLR